MRFLAGIFALLTAAAGWFYLFYSRAAHDLSGIEERAINRRRVGLRRVGGVAMLLLGGFFFAGFYAVDPRASPGPFLAVWLTVFALLVVLVVLAMTDVRLTRKLRKPKSG